MNQTSNIIPLPKITRPATRAIIGLFLFVIGLQAWMNLGHLIWGRNYQWLALLIILCLSFIPPVPRYVALALDAIRRLTARHPNLTALLIFIAATAFLYHCAIFQDIPLFPHWEDEFVYLIQTQMMAHGRLWMPHHPLARYFDSLYLITGHAYAGMYFPGAAIMLAPTVWLGLPKYVGPLLISGISAALMFLVAAELFDGVMGILAALMLVSLSIFRMTSTMALSHGPMLLLALLMVLAYLRWRASGRSKRWLIVLAAATGWAAITRPIDAFCYAAIIAVAMALDLRRQPLAAWLKTAAVAIPFLSLFLLLQIVFNLGATGHWNLTPYSDYIHSEFPSLGLQLSAPAPTPVPQSDLPQIRAFYRDFMLPTMSGHQLNNMAPDFFQSRLPLVWDRGFPDPFFWILIPFAFLALFKNRAWVLAAMLPAAMLFYLAWSFLPHYLVPFLPCIIIVLLCGIPAAVSFFPTQAHRVQCVLVLGVMALCILSLPQLDRTVSDRSFAVVELQQINDALQQIHPPAIVLFHFHDGDLVNGRVVRNSTQIEPVYNFDVPWPDDAPIIRAHDRNGNISALGAPGDQDRPLYLYYAKIDPHRTVYLYDRLFPAFKSRLQPLGSVADLVNATAPPPSIHAP